MYGGGALIALGAAVLLAPAGGVGFAAGAIVAGGLIVTSMAYSYSRTQEFKAAERIFDDHLWGGPGVVSQSNPGGH